MTRPHVLGGETGTAISRDRYYQYQSARAHRVKTPLAQCEQVGFTRVWSHSPANNEPHGSVRLVLVCVERSGGRGRNRVTCELSTGKTRRHMLGPCASVFTAISAGFDPIPEFDLRSGNKHINYTLFQNFSNNEWEKKTTKTKKAQKMLF